MKVTIGMTGKIHMTLMSLSKIGSLDIVIKGTIAPKLKNKKKMNKNKAIKKEIKVVNNITEMYVTGKKGTLPYIRSCFISLNILLSLSFIAVLENILLAYLT